MPVLFRDTVGKAVYLLRPDLPVLQPADDVPAAGGADINCKIIFHIIHLKAKDKKQRSVSIETLQYVREAAQMPSGPLVIPRITYSSAVKAARYGRLYACVGILHNQADLRG